MPRRPDPTALAPLAVPFREVRHEQPDDCLHCEAIAVRGRLHQWDIPAHRHPGLHQFQLLERGAATATLDGLQLRLRAPAALMLAAGTVHAFRYDPDSAGHQVTVPSALLQQALAGTPALAQRLAASLVLDRDSLGSEVSELVDLFLQITHEFHLARPGRSAALQSQALLLALWFLRRGADGLDDAERSAWRDTLVQRFRALLELHLRRHPPLSFYAGQLQVSVDHLSRACRAVAGQSALDLVHERLLLEARRLLAYTTLGVAEVAQDLGYGDPAYFSRFFARHAGRSPSAFRAAMAQGLVSGPP